MKPKMWRKVYVTAVLAIAGIRASADSATIRMVAAGGETGKDGIRYSVATLESTDVIPHVGSTTLKLAIRFPGQFSAIDGKEFVTNRVGDLGAVTFQAATKTHTTFVITARQHGEIGLISDFNARVAKACGRGGKAINEEDISIRSVDGGELTVTSEDYGHWLYTVTVRLMATGELKLIKYSRSRL
jgi:hypothetical protein